MKSLKQLSLIVVVIAALAAAGLIESFNLLAARHREHVIQELNKVLGQDVSFESLEVNLFGRPGFVAKEFRIADDSRFAATPAVRARELVLGVSLWNLLLRELVITSLTFDRPEFQIITDERGTMNLTALLDRKTELRKFPRLRAPASERKQIPVSFAIDEVAIKQGRIEYIDRSIKQPAELRISNLSMSVQGFQPQQTTKIRLAAALAEGLGQDVRITGELTPGPQQSWLQRSIDFTIQFDSLHVPVVARAIAALRDKIPSQLDVTGPMALQVRARGTPERPRLENILLKIPLFGSSEYNAVVSGDIKFTERRTWEEAQLEGKLTVDPLSLPRLRRFGIFERLLPPALVSEGNVTIASNFAGTWENLRVGALVRAGTAELRYKNWLYKAPQAPAAIRMQISRGKQGWSFHPSELTLGANKIDFSGSVEYEPAARLRLTMRNQGGSVAAWNRFLTLPAFDAVAGKVDFDVSMQKSLIDVDARWHLLGGLKLSDAVFKHRTSGRALENLQASVSFHGMRARVENGRFRLGNSLILLNAMADNIFEPRLVSTIRSPDLLLADLPMLNPNPAMRLKDVLGQADIFIENNQWVLVGSLAAPQASLNDWSLRDLRADIALATAGLKFRNLRAQILNGQLRSEGFWPANGAPAQNLEFSSQVNAVDVRALLTQLFPPLRDRVEGRLNGRAEFYVNGTDPAGKKRVLNGAGEALLQHGTIKDFNLISQLLLKGSGSAVSAAAMARVPPGFAALFNRPDTPIDALKANFTVDQKRISTDNLVLTTPDYTITGAGWVGFDRVTRWNGLLVLSPRLTQEVQRDYRILRYLLDRRGRLAIGFRIEGEIPNVTIRLDNRALAQALRTGTPARGGDTDDQDGGAPRASRHWLPDTLERLLKR
ncbi:MAG TPA: AsmA family protein [Candidatus Binatia bacterium]|nr:AsmA family protein [Candidatus Binatia bacterium]